MTSYGWGGGRFPRGYGRGEERGRRGPRYGGDFPAPFGGYPRERYGRGDFSSVTDRNRYDTGRPRPGPDDRLRAAVRQKLFEDTWLDARNIQVDAEDGVVYLAGTVSSHLESRYAWDDAWETDGVRGVVMRLEVEERNPAD